MEQLVDTLVGSKSLVVIGRGPTLAIAREASLNSKKPARCIAEAFSGAEFLHGPVALVSPRYPVLMFTPTDAAAHGMRQLATSLHEKGTALLTTDPGARRTGRLPLLPPTIRRLTPFA